MLIITYLTTAYVPLRVRLSEEYRRALLRVCARFDCFAGKQLTLADFSEPLVASFLSARSLQVGAATVNNDRRMLLTLWRAAYDDGETPTPPRERRIKRLREPEPDPKAWTAQQVAMLLRYCATLPGVIDGVPWSVWWGTLFAVVYCTGARIGAALKTPCEAYEPASGITIRETKTGKTRWHRLPAWCSASLAAALLPRRQLLWPWACHRRTFFKRARKIIEAAGLPAPKTGRQLFYRLRRTCLSYCAADNLTLAQETAGHASPRTTERYIDRSIAPRRSAADVLPDPRTT